MENLDIESVESTREGPVEAGIEEETLGFNEKVSALEHVEEEEIISEETEETEDKKEFNEGKLEDCLGSRSLLRKR
jgi:hypothetical protein